MRGETRLLMYYLLAFLVGLGMAVQTAVNTQLKELIGGPLQASLINVIIAALALTLLLTLTGNINHWEGIGDGGLNWWKLTGGIIGALYLVGMIVSAPQIGPANMFSLIVGGQIVTAIVLDHFGLLGFAVHTVTPLRAMGVGMLVISVYIIQSN
ncbi:MAG: rane protein [Firmicutes bacterium]|nr:rane protein [Bacillota bacterium]